MKKILLFSLSMIVLGLLILIGSIESRKTIASTMTYKLQSEGYDIENFAIRDNTIIVTINSTGEDRINAEDIFTLRRVRNEARTQARNGKLVNIKAQNDIIINSSGKTIYDSTINDSFVIPEDNESQSILNTNVTESYDKVKSMLEEAFRKYGIDIDITSVSESQLQGTFVSLELKNHNNDYGYINETVPIIQELVEEQNQKNAKIVEYTLTVKSMNKSDEIIFLLSADLLYRDFLWWQSPDYDNQTWTNSSPHTVGESTGTSK